MCMPRHVNTSSFNSQEDHAQDQSNDKHTRRKEGERCYVPRYLLSKAVKKQYKEYDWSVNQTYDRYWKVVFNQSSAEI